MTYSARLREGSSAFVKVFPPDRLPPTMLAALPVVARLGLPEVPRPLPSRTGALHESLGDAVVVVFEHVDGDRMDATRVDLQVIGDLLGRLHRLPVGPATRETFHWPHTHWWPSALRRASAPSSDAVRERLRRWLHEQSQHLDETWRRLHELGAACRAAELEFVLTHGDWPFNVLRSADGSIHLVDWDELMLAPPERDTWFASDKPEFQRAYDGPPPHELATAYYLHSRYLEDLVGLVMILLGEHDRHPPEHALEALENEWMSGLRARVERFAERR